MKSKNKEAIEEKRNNRRRAQGGCREKKNKVDEKRRDKREGRESKLEASGERGTPWDPEGTIDSNDGGEIEIKIN